jgi:hypothetical protein
MKLKLKINHRIFSNNIIFGIIELNLSFFIY